jgi:hypothetical protein
VEVSLPRDSQWFDFWTGGLLSSHQIEQDLKATPIPVYVRAGAFVPMFVEAPQSTSHYDSTNVELHYYHHASVSEAQSELFDDDGYSASSLRSGTYEISAFNASWDNRGLTFRLENTGSDYAGRPERRSIRLVVHGWRSSPQGVVVNDQKAADVTYDESVNSLVIPITLPADSEVTIEIH